MFSRTARTLVFIYNDPGAQNYLRPVAEKAKEEGCTVILKDSRTSQNPGEFVVHAVESAPKHAVFVFGLSMNHIERLGIAAAKSRKAITIQFIDPPGLLSRLEGITHADTADLYLLGMQSMAHTLAQEGKGVNARYCGPTYIEKCLLDANANRYGTAPKARARVLREYYAGRHRHQRGYSLHW
jgi:hypothetical protein